MEEKSRGLSAKIPESEEEQEKFIKLLEERLEKHDENRKVVQGKLTEILNKLTEQVYELEEGINRELCEKFAFEEDRLQAALNDLRGNSTISALQKAKAELRTIQSYKIIENKKAGNDLTTLYELKTERRTIPEDGSVELASLEMNSSTHGPSNTTEMSETPCNPGKLEEERERLIELLEERLVTYDENKKVTQDKLHEICEKLRAQICELGDRINKEFEDKFTSEDDRLQAALNEFRGNRAVSALQKAKAELLVEQSYEVIENKEDVEEEEDDDDDDDDDEYEEEDEDEENEEEEEEKEEEEEEDDDDDDDDDEGEDADEGEDENDSVEPNFNLTTMYQLKAERRIVTELIVMRKPTNVRVAGVNRGIASVQFTCLDPNEERVLSDNAIVNPVKYKCLLFKKGNEQESKEYFLGKDDGNDSSFLFTPDILEVETTYRTRVKMVVGDSESEWSDDVVEFTTPEFNECCVWKKCPDDVNEKRKYNVDEKNPRIATKNNDSNGYCTIIGNTYIPLGTVTSWGVKILKSMYNDGWNIYIGVATFDINQNDYDNYEKYGWYLDCYHSVLRSGPPHKYYRKEYGPRKDYGQYVHTGDSVGVVVDTTNGDLSFVLNGVNCGVAYCGIPLDKPLVPCVLLDWQGDSVELDTSELEENDVDSSIPVPSNIITANSTTWDSITLAWDEVADASFYQIEVDGNNSGDAATTNTFTKRGLLPETEHSFRVRTVRGSSVSEWSGVVKGRTLKAPEFPECAWKTCPDYVVERNKYSVDGRNPRVATKINNDSYCTIIGNTHIPLSTVTSWSIKVLKSEDNDGGNIFIGIAPFDINQNDDDNYYYSGWYFGCWCSTLFSGPPHNYWDKAYGPRKESKGQYVYTGDSVGVVVDTEKGELSFVLNGVNCGVAYCGIPLDKPLVPCVILCYQGDSIELDTSEMKENVDSSIPVPPNITTKDTTWDSIILAWDNVADASFYQIEVDESRSWGAATTNTFTKRGLLAETKHSFRVRTVRGSSVSEWSSVVKGRTLKAPEFPECVWKTCSGDVVDDDKKYNVDGRNPRVATKVSDGDDFGFCTIIGNTHIPLNTVTSWSIKILKSRDNVDDDIYIGIAPNDINQNNDYNNYYSCGWYFHCYDSSLYSGPPHKYCNQKYGPRKEGGEYVHTGDSMGVVVDTIRGDFSFVLNGVNLGVAYEGIPLDKPLVPCVLLYHPGDSVELII